MGNSFTKFITFSIHADCRTQQYMQEWLTFQIWFFAISGWSSMQNSNEPVFMRTGNKVLLVIHHFV